MSRVGSLSPVTPNASYLIWVFMQNLNKLHDEISNKLCNVKKKWYETQLKQIGNRIFKNNHHKKIQ